MKRISFFFYVTILFFGCKQADKSEHKREQSKDIEVSINKIMDDWHQAATNADYKAFMSTMDASSIFIGTDATENWTKQQFEEFSKPIFNKGTAWDFEPLESNIYISNSHDVVWFDEILNTWMGVCRGSGVLQKTDNKWKIEHYVLSVDIPNEDIQDVINAKKQNDSLFLQQINATSK